MHFQILNLPPDTASVEDLAEYWAAHDAELRQISRWLYVVRRRLADAVRDGGPVITPSGRLGLEAAGYEYPAEIAQEFPGLGKHVVTAMVDTIEQAERILSLVTEEVPAAQVSHALTLGGGAAARLGREGGGQHNRNRDVS